MVTVTTDNAINAEGLADAREAAAEDPRACYNAPACECYSCDRQCGGTIHPDSCGPVEADAEGRPICRACREMAQVWGDHRTGLQAAISQDRIRVQVKFGESAWLNPASARAFALVLLVKAEALARTRAEDAAAMAQAFLTAPDADLERFDTEGLIRQLVAAAMGTAPPSTEEQVANAIARGLASLAKAKAEAEANR